MKKVLHIIFALFLCAEASVAQDKLKGDIGRFAAQSGSTATIDKATGSISFIRFSPGKAYQVAGGDVKQKSSNFMTINPNIFGIRANQDDFRFREEKIDNYGLGHVTMQQTYKGVPVFDGMYKFHYDKKNELTAINGNFIADIKVNTVPTLAQHEAEALAIKYVQNQQAGVEHSLKVNKSTLYIFQKGLAQGYNGSKYLVYEVEVRNDVDIREFLYIDAHNGVLIEQFTGIHSALHRTLYETSITPANKKWGEGDVLPGTLDQWQESEVRTAGSIYNLMSNAFGRDSYDGLGATMITVNNAPGIQCPNANWNGVSANYCTGTAADDVVAHEWAHAYTEYTSQLIYAWQAGAMNESYSDIWGETVDLLNNFMDAGESDAPRTGCGSSTRWQMGEKASSFGGALRDMWDPTCKGAPGKVSDSQYWCASNDQGGVHSNSGVLNHAYALLVDGGTYNGQIINGLGLVKAAHIFWRAQSVYMTATTDFAAQADYLESALTDLLGVNLQGLSTGAAVGNSGQIITVADAAELSKVLLAVELRKEPDCGFQPILKPVAALCEGASPGLALFSENFDLGLGLFSATTETLSGGWVARNWISSTAPAGRPGKVAYGVNYTGGNCTVASDQTGLIRLESPVITIPGGTAGNLNMTFDHYVNTEAGWDGGNIKYSLNGGAWTLLPATAFTANGYNNVLNTAGASNTNPLQGQEAFTGANEGALEGSWGQSQIDLTSLGLLAGGNIQFRWELGTDLCGGTDGWYIDDVRVYTCAVTPAIHFVTDKSTVNEGEATTISGCFKYIDKVVTVQIDKAPTQPVTVTFNTPTGTAKMGPTADYTITPSTVTLEAGALTQNVTIRIFNDAYVEGNETINLSYNINANGGNGFAAASLQTYQLTIVDDDLTPGNYTEELLNSGFNDGAGGWTVKNGGNTLDTWQLTEYSNAALDASGRPFFYVDSDATRTTTVKMDEIIESPAINTFGKKNLVLTFSQDWNPYNGGFAEQGYVDVWDGSTWQNVRTQTQTSGHLGSIFGAANVQTINIPDAYANVNMKIRFRYKASFDLYWAVDNVKLTSSHSTDIQATVNTGSADQQYLGPNETAVFYDPTTGNLMAKIKNLTAHDYGCTTVEVDRAGQDEVAWVGTYKITKKTFKVTPANNNPTGKYEITLYYKTDELPNFNGSDITSMGKSAGAIGAANLLSSSFAVVQASAAFNTDLAYTATFDTGFSGFGLSNAPPMGPLPVTLTTFEGKNTVEGNLLNWATTMEVNNEYFAVERTSDGKNFTEIGKVSGIGNSSVLNRYKFLDGASPKGNTYYRLKQVDKGGVFSYSRIISVNTLNQREIKFFPNPVQSMLTLEMPDAEVQSVQVQIINSAGQKVFAKDAVKIVNGNFSLDVSKLPAGVYQVILSGDKKAYNVSVLKL